MIPSAIADKGHRKLLQVNKRDSWLVAALITEFLEFRRLEFALIVVVKVRGEFEDGPTAIVFFNERVQSVKLVLFCAPFANNNSLPKFLPTIGNLVA